ncbi:methyl-accepting chemotaxis protein [Natrialba taiwanensis]|uniref:Methyl-accepting chemotaxis sensory transducer with Pas/Pac sensor n=1 Tax=Natrialba taiwanensis DSM 12281 TaxID=1230458 RepID=M0A9M4_9EURY|nr:methyl-accepting chemotaxis protein [Natrialba taiwanensis]ELY95475.1 methyl-accepting chemotaxis sensory transducer with Pas/Pac sensor [Natrialba taiwanensis DSM 12281]
MDSKISDESRDADSTATPVSDRPIEGDHGEESVGELAGAAAPVIRQAGYQQLFDGTGIPTFILNTEGTIVEWNAALAELTGVERADALGHDYASELFYPDGRRGDTLADKVLQAPERAHERFGVELRDPEQRRYGDTSTMVDRHGDEKHIDFSATPLYRSEGGSDDLLGVIEVVVDRTDIVAERDATTALVRELQTTATEISHGDLTARAQRLDSFQLLDSELVAVVDDLNEMAASLETLTGRVSEQATEMQAAVDDASAAADDIADNVAEQHRLLEDSASEMQTFAAGMEEVAAQSEEVDTAAQAAKDAVEHGLDAGADAHEATEDVVEIGDELAANIDELTAKMDDIGSVVEVISDVADETNLLALNANIEAARAGDSGDGFAVVADHVKTLANETQDHTEEITANLDELQAQFTATTDAVSRSHDRIDHAETQIDAVITELEAIADSVDEAAHGISEVARVIDDQTASVEELTSTIETVRDRSERSETATERIVEATTQQEQTIDQLVRRVDELQTDD